MSGNSDLTSERTILLTLNKDQLAFLIKCMFEKNILFVNIIYMLYNTMEMPLVNNICL